MEISALVSVLDQPHLAADHLHGWGLRDAARGRQVLLEIASFTNPCKTIKGSFIDGKFIRIAEKLHPGWSRVYARVLTEGQIQSGDPVQLNSPPR